MRTYAIGDVHGCLDLLVDLLGQIDADRAGEPCRIVCLGDYVDRGLDSAGVVGLLRARQAAVAPGEMICLKGNHEDLLLQAVDGVAHAAGNWLRNGGIDTLAAFGVSRPQDLPVDVVSWLRRCPTVFEDMLRCFVHAGLNPAFDRNAQSDADRLWIRGPFLESNRDFGRYVVHGHTPLRGGWPDVRSTRVNLDTAAVFGGRLTAAIFTDEQAAAIGFLQAGQSGPAAAG